MLMDEPFGAIDPINREVIQDEFLKIQKRLGKAVMFVSHDIDEAVKMAHKVAIFRGGKLEQFDSPNNVLAHPANNFIADFVGGNRTLKRLRLVTAGRALATGAPVVQAADSLDKAAGLVKEHGRETIVMVDQQGAPRGFVRLEIAQGRKGTVGEFHGALPATIGMQEDLRTAVSLMFMHDVSWLACVDADGAFKGYLTQRGITHLLGETYQPATQAAA
jgi:osmoprotectant transport system ATP-binding protein